MRKTIYLCLSVLILTLWARRSHAQYTISSHSDTVSTTMCGDALFSLYTAGCTTGLSMKAYFGDGTNSTASVYCYSTSGTVTFSHSYPATGSYTVKFVLYNGTVAIDSVEYSYYYHYCSYMQAYFYYDANGNCVQDAGDELPMNTSIVKVDSAGVPIDTISGLMGVGYTSEAPPGTVYTFTILTPPAGLIPSCPSSGILTFTTVPTGYSVPSQYLGFNCATSAFDLSLNAIFEARVTGGWANGMVHNSTCTNTAALVKIDFGPKYTFSHVVPAYSYTVTGNSVTLDIGTVHSTNVRYYSAYFNPVGSLTIGDTVNTTQTVYPLTGDADPTNNIIVRCDTIKSGYDPNHKSVYPTGNITAGATLTYTLEFENTGNDTAHNIHIMDTLSNFLDPKSAKILGSTHKVDLVKITGAGNVLKFDFPNIMLADSSHHDANKGMVVFSIKAKSTLVPGTVIPNRGGIYFDTNPVVLTNTAYSKIPMPAIGGISSISGKDVLLYPNPVKNTLSFVVDPGTYSSLSISNVLGQQVLSQDFSPSVNVSNLPSGIYYITLKGSNDVTTMKFEKL